MRKRGQRIGQPERLDCRGLQRSAGAVQCPSLECLIFRESLEIVPERLLS